MQLKVLGKGNNERIVFLGKKSLEAISTWLLVRNRWISKAGVERLRIFIHCTIWQTYCEKPFRCMHYSSVKGAWFWTYW